MRKKEMEECRLARDISLFPGILKMDTTDPKKLMDLHRKVIYNNKSHHTYPYPVLVKINKSIDFN